MPPRAKITKEMILDVAFAIIQKEGIDKVTARSISEQLHCSTQPVLYYFATVDEIKRAVYQKVDAYHSDYVMKFDEDCENPMLAIGLNYIQFAIEERNLFRFLFQTNEFSEQDIMELLNSEELVPIYEVLRKILQVSLKDAKEIFYTLFVFVHGYASLYANNTMIYDEATVVKSLQRVFEGSICVVKGEYHE